MHPRQEADRIMPEEEAGCAYCGQRHNNIGPRRALHKALAAINKDYNNTWKVPLIGRRWQR